MDCKEKIPSALVEVQETIVKNKIVDSEMELEKKLSEELNTILKQEKIIRAQKAKVNWLQLGDKNTRYFQIVATIFIYFFIFLKSEMLLEKLKIAMGFGGTWVRALNIFLCRISNCNFLVIALMP